MAGQKSFSASVSEWAQQSERRMTAVFKKSAEDVILQVKEKTPVVDGFLRASLLASTSAMPLIDPKANNSEGASVADNDGQIALVIAGAVLGQTIYAGFTAAYARRIEYGFKGEDSLGRTYNQEGVGMVRLAAQEWANIVARNSAIAKARVEARAAARGKG